MKKATFYREIVEGETGWIQNDYYNSTGTLKLSASLHGKKPDVYHGQASWFREDGTLLRRAQFVRGVLQGTDEYFDLAGRPVYTKIVNGEKIGYAQYWSESGEPVLENGTGYIQIPYERGLECLEVRNGEVIASYLIRETEQDTIYEVCDRPAELIGGLPALFQGIFDNINYPVDARRMGLTGMVKVEIVIDKLGKTEEARIFEGVHPVLDEEALRVIIVVDPSFVPAMHKGDPVKSRTTFPILFRLNN